MLLRKIQSKKEIYLITRVSVQYHQLLHKWAWYFYELKANKNTTPKANKNATQKCKITHINECNKTLHITIDIYLHTSGYSLCEAYSAHVYSS